eukprot:6212457-Pleurochrysis_carterae.AAC.3
MGEKRLESGERNCVESGPCSCEESVDGDAELEPADPLRQRWRNTRASIWSVERSCNTDTPICGEHRHANQYATALRHTT